MEWLTGSDERSEMIALARIGRKDQKVILYKILSVHRVPTYTGLREKITCWLQNCKAWPRADIQVYWDPDT